MSAPPRSTPRRCWCRSSASYPPPTRGGYQPCVRSRTSWSAIRWCIATGSLTDSPTGSRGRKAPSRCAPSGTSSASPAWEIYTRHGYSSRRCSGTPITWGCTARSSGPRRSTWATSPRRSHTWRSSAPPSTSTGGSRRPATTGDHRHAGGLTEVSLPDALVFGSAGVVLKVRRHHREPGCALVFGKARRPRGARRTISQLTVLKIELTLGARTCCGQSSIASVRGDDHCCAFLSFLPRDPAPPTTCEFLDVSNVLLSGNSIKRGQREHHSKK